MSIFAKTQSRCALQSRLYWRVCAGAKALERKREITAEIKLIPHDERIAREKAYAEKKEQHLLSWAAYAQFADILATGAEYEDGVGDINPVELWDKAIAAHISGRDAELLIGEAIDAAVIADREKTAAWDMR